MTTITTKFRSRKSALAQALEMGHTEDTVVVTKLATAKYELQVPEPRKVMSNEELTPDDHATDCMAVHAEQKATTKTKIKATRVNRHWNDDGSLTLYVGGIKVRRIGGEDNEEEAEDPEAFAERFLTRKYLRRDGGWVWGRTTQGHNWKNKKTTKSEEEAS